MVFFITIFAWKQFSCSTPAIKDSNGQKLSESITSLDKVRIGNMDQWIQIRGNAASNPVLLWLHGGPGAAQMPIAHYYNGELEEKFIVVH